MATLRRSTAALAALTLLSLSSLTSAAPLNKKQQVSGLTTSPEDVQGKTFDYVVVGGGLAGLVVAGRLSEDEDVSVRRVCFQSPIHPFEADEHSFRV
jgi:choline dehydrogenase